MTAIQQLAQLCIKKIEASQNGHTSPDRFRALKVLKNIPLRFRSDDFIVQKFKTETHEVNKHGHFGWRGRPGSTFLKFGNEFLNRAAYFTQLKSQGAYFSTSGIPELGFFLIHQLESTKHPTQDEISALQQLKAKLTTAKKESSLGEAFRDRYYSDASLIALAKKLYQTLNQSRCFIFYHKHHQQFLSELYTFIEDGKDLFNFAILNMQQKLTSDLENDLLEAEHLKRFSV